MSTRCRIGIKLKDKSVVHIYNHSDGYPSYVGRILIEHYSTKERIMMLMNLGDISLLGTEPIDCPELWDSMSAMTHLSLNSDFIPLCRTYKSRGDKDVSAKCSKSVLAYVRKYSEEYNYLFENNRWFVVTADGRQLNYESVEDAIKKEN